MKKTLALILAFAMVFSTISFVFADEEVVAVSDEAAALGTLGVLEGDGGGVTAEYTAKELNRLTAAIMVLKLKGLYAEALEFDGVENFPDAENMAWAEGKNILAYLKANPEVGFAGDGSAFNPDAIFTEQMLYKVLLESLGYKQTTGEVVGDFAWDGTIAFAEEIGLKPENAEKLTVDGLAKAVVGALKAENKDGKVWIDVLVEAGKVDEGKAVAAGFVKEAPAVTEVEVKEANAIGNTVVEVKFKAAVDEAAANLGNYAIEGLEIKDAAIAGEKLVRLETEAMKSGKLYELVVGEKTFKFTGIAKVSGAPEIDGKPKSEDVDEVVIKFTKKIDLASGTDVDNYSIAGVEVVEAEVDGDKVTLTTEGLKNRTDYTVKVANIKSIDGASKKSDSKSFRTNFDFTAPSIKGEIERETFQRIVVNFTEKVTQETAEDIDNYEIKLNKTDGDIIEILSVTWDEDEDYQDNVTIVTEPMEKNKDYKLTINNIADQRKVANVMTRSASKTFKGLAEDKTGPKVGDVRVLSPDRILVVFTDDSRIDADSALDLNNYELKDLDIVDIEKYRDELKEFKAILTVEEMETDKGYELKIFDIIDEFGNEMKSEYKKTVRAYASEFKSARLTGQKATGKNTILLTFNDELDKSTAENISNYEITKGIGAPTKAKYNKTAKTVTLTVAELINGFASPAKPYYKVTVDGVEDIAGNVLYYKENLDTWSEKWDNDGPELEDVDVANKYVVALAFDEKVAVDANAELQLVALGSDNKWGTTVAATLEYGDLVEDDTVVEFYADLSDDGLDPAVTYAVYKVVYGSDVDGGIKDLKDNPFLASSFELGEFEFKGSDKEIEKPYMENYEQTDGRTFEVTMSKNVKLQTGVTSINEGDLTFTISVDTTDRNIVEFVANGKIIDSKDYEFKFADIFEDYYGVAAEEDTKVDSTPMTVLTGEFKDDNEPYIDDVVAKNRMVVKVVFDEEIANVSYPVSFFTLRNYDLDKEITISSIALNSDGDILELTLAKALEARYEYELTFVKPKTGNNIIKDVVNNELKGDDSKYYFQGTNLAE